MAKKPDFTQKLLDDLRRRKERMTTTPNTMSQTSKSSNQISADKYRNFKQASQGSREVNLNETIGSTTQYKNKWFDNIHKRSLSIEDSPREIVPVGRAHTSENIADLSMALAFALKNGVKHGTTGSFANPVAGLLQQFGRSMDFGEMDRRSKLDSSILLNGQFPTLSHLHIKEISEGAEKLNQILKSSYNGLSFDKYSVDIGKDLLKGAIDLEESLRMLVNLQEASEFMIRSQRKHRVRLVEVEDNNGETTEEVNKQKKLERPIFSFDGPLRNSLEDVQEGTKTSHIKQKRFAPSSLSESQNINSNQTTVSHRRSASCGSSSNIFSAIPNHKRNSSSECLPEKGRIPNVIAKLMGLEELPPNFDSKTGAHKDPSVKQGVRAGNDSKKSLEDSTKKVEPVILNSGKLSSQTVRHRVLQTNNLDNLDASTLYADKILVNRNQTLETMIYDGKLHLKGQKDAEMLANKHEKKRRHENPNLKERKSTGRGETREHIFEDNLQMMAPHIQKHAEGTHIMRQNSGTKESVSRKETRNADEGLLKVSNQQKTSHDSNSQLRHTLRKSESESPDARYQAIEREQHSVKDKLHQRKQKQNEMLLKGNSSRPTHDVLSLQKKPIHTNHTTSSKNPKEAFVVMASKTSSSPKNSHHEDFIRKVVKLNMKKTAKENFEEQRPYPRDTKASVDNVAAPIAPILLKKPMHVPPLQNMVAIPIAQVATQNHVDVPSMKNKVNNTEVLNSTVPGKTEENVSRRNAYLHRNAKPLKLQEQEHKKHNITNKSNEAVVSTKLSKEAEAEAVESIQPLNSTKDVQKIAELISVPGNTTTEEYQRLKQPDTISENANLQNINTNVSDSLRASTVLLDEDHTLKTSDIRSIQIKGLHESKIMDISKSLQQVQQKTSKFKTPGILTESENHLKQILIKSQRFLNAAEALFKLQIPVGILHDSADNCQDEDSKLILDCGYEVMKRKGKRQELTFNPYVNTCVVSKRPKCLDNLVQELHGDLEILSDENGSIEYDAPDCLHKMLQNDIENGKPDVNCMWDFGWNGTLFACIEKEEVIRDLEKHVLNGLIDEITGDLLHLSIVI